MIRKFYGCILGIFLPLLLLLSGCSGILDELPAELSSENRETTGAVKIDAEELLEDTPYIIIHENIPSFSEDEITKECFEEYSELDDLGRCGTAFACVGIDLMPVEKRGSIGHIEPTGWNSIQYDFIEGKYLYNRCHLIGYQLSGENANKKNLITGTRYLNVNGMLPFEDMVADYVKETGNHVMYRVTPVFEGQNLVASGVEMEAWSVEDEGQGISYHVFVYNIQPGVEIDYATGASKEKAAAVDSEETGVSYILNTSSKKFHLSSCSSVKRIQEKNKEVFTGARNELLQDGYEPCGICNP